MRDKVLAALAVYNEGGTIGAALDAQNLRRGDFYKFKAENPDIEDLYVRVQQARADMMIDEAYSLSTADMPDPRAARVKADIRIKIAGLYDRARFGDKVTLEHDAGPNVLAAIAAAKDRIARPLRDLGNVIEAQHVEVIDLTPSGTTDKQSDDPPTPGKKPNVPSIFD